MRTTKVNDSDSVIERIVVSSATLEEEETVNDGGDANELDDLQNVSRVAILSLWKVQFHRRKLKCPSSSFSHDTEAVQQS